MKKEKQKIQSGTATFRLRNKDVWMALKYYCLIEQMDIGVYVEKLIKKDLKEKLKEEMTQKYSTGNVAKIKTNKKFLDALKD